MTIFAPPAHGPDSATQLTRLLENLAPQSKATLRRLMHVLRPPVDAPRTMDVINSACKCINAYKKSLLYPNKSINQLVAEIEQLTKVTLDLQIQLFGGQNDLEKPMYRRLTRHPGWALCLAIKDYPENLLFTEAAGVEIALSLAKEKAFADGYANEIRRALENRTIPTENFQASQLAFERRINKAKRQASILFENVPTIGTQNKQAEYPLQSFEPEAKQQLLQKRQYARSQHRCGILNRHCQSKIQVVQSAIELRQNAESDDETSILIILAFCAGLSAKLTAAMPLIHNAKEDWMMKLDTHSGCLWTNISPMLPDAAVPAENSAENYWPSNKIIVKPLPQFIVTKLAELFINTPNAMTIGDLIPYANSVGTTLTIPGSKCGIAPSVTKFLNSAAPYALQIGIDRLAAAVITNDFSIIPSAKFYYAKIEREEIWQASNALFHSLGWGTATLIEQGMATGSAIVATRMSVTALYQWMVSELDAAQLGKHCSVNKLVEFHNIFAKLCASLIIFLLGLRNVKEIKLTPQHLMTGATYAPVFDKRTGQLHGPLPVPINRLLEKQHKLYLTHCVAVLNRLSKTNVKGIRKTRTYLRKLIENSSGKLFFQLNETCQPSPIGSADLTSWWPEHLRFPANFSRSFWQSELHAAGLEGSLIDLFMRHQLPGAESYSSCSHRSPKQCLDKIGQMQDKILNEMNLVPVQGLTKKRG